MPLKAQKPRLKTSDEGLTQKNPNGLGQVGSKTQLKDLSIGTLNSRSYSPKV